MGTAPGKPTPPPHAQTQGAARPVPCLLGPLDALPCGDHRGGGWHSRPPKVRAPPAQAQEQQCIRGRAPFTRPMLSACGFDYAGAGG